MCLIHEEVTTMIHIFNYDSSSNPTLGTTLGIALLHEISNTVGLEFVLSVNYIGDGLRDALDPRIRGR